MENKYTLRNILLNSAGKWPDKPALGFAGEQSYTYKKLLEKSSAWTNFLKNTLKLKKQDRVVILSESRPEWGAAYFGITAAGFIAVPVLPDFAPSQIAKIISHSEAKAVIFSKKQLPSFNNAVKENNTLADLPSVLLETGKIFSGPEKDSFIQKPENPADCYNNEISPDDIAVILYTSGTTGTSKGVTHTHGAIAWNAVVSVREGLGENPEIKHLSILPLAHTYECTLGLVGVLNVGGEIKYLDGPPTSSRLLPALEKEKPSMMLTVPLLMDKIYRSKISGPLKSKKTGKIIYSIPLFRKLIHKIAGKKIYRVFGGNLIFFGIGGAPLARDVERFLIDAKFPYSVGYGLTETAPLLAGGKPKDMKFRSTGKVVPGISIRIDNPNSKGIGEIQAKGPSIMKEYWREPELTAGVFTDDGWFKTGDLGILKGNYLYIKGRLKDVLIGPNGENIYPDEIESVINSHSFVAESLAYIKNGSLVAKIHLDAEKLGSEIKKLGLAGNNKIKKWKKDTLEYIRKETNKHLGRHAKVQAVEEQEELFEKTPSMKIKRFLYTKKDKK